MDVKTTKPPRFNVFKLFLLVFLGLLIAGFLIPDPAHIPVANATTADWHPNSFWYEPWGTSGVHKGIDIFAPMQTPVVATTHLFIVYRGEIKKGGRIIVGLGPKWQLHYFAHLATINPTPRWVSSGTPIGTVGDTGNAKGKPPHLHYSILSLVPLPWKVDASTQGYKKAFYVNPNDLLKK